MLLKKERYIELVISYIENSLGLSIEPVLWERRKKLPLLLKELYRFYTFKIHNQEFLLFIVVDEEEITPGTIAKHRKMLARFWKEEIIYSQKTLSATDRNRLVQNKIPFIIPDKQLYLPFIGVNFREIFTPERKSANT